MKIKFLPQQAQWLEGKYSCDDTVKCNNCGSEVEFYWDSVYDGYRGKCSNCGINWAES